MRKGQSAMEYLMTYGWAILIVIIAGGVIWYYASQATTSAGPTKGGFSTVDVDSPWSLSGATGTLTFKAINKVGKDINITAVYANGVMTNQNVAVSSGATSGWITAAIGSTGTSGSSYQLSPVAIQYYLASDSSKTPFNATGTLSGARQ